ncbi:hypothetical protein [Leptolinea tardivitalis]|uniref:Uncharacterized protein n=1 Tax=Leptolinea tardivitalis TaxID=229920 RepID=A0A0N8GKP3_9CHLR|nr:hypothetical protein [Leptolinea tardivitalis]KPL70258.1 hypothetical protein ADM99_13870 [Leptolinea tardivitalis]
MEIHPQVRTLVAAGLSVLGIIVPAGWWRRLALAGAGLSVLMLGLDHHPFFGIGPGASLLIHAALLIKVWMVFSQMGL